jgi:uncharacterized caspase-like protein
MRAPEGTLISYATQPGSVAQDGSDGHSRYTKALAATIKQVGLDIFQTFNQVGLSVKRQTGGSQQPWVSSSPIDGSFYFTAPASPQVNAEPPHQLGNALPAQKGALAKLQSHRPTPTGVGKSLTVIGCIRASAPTAAAAVPAHGS